MRLPRSSTLLGAAAGAVLLAGLAACSDATASDEATTAALTSTLAIADGGLAGTWRLNKDESDPPPADGRFGLRHGRTPDQGTMDGAPKRSARAPRSVELPQLTIAQTDSTVTITGPRGRARVLYTDGREVTVEPMRAMRGGRDGMRGPREGMGAPPEALVIKVVAKFEGEALVVPRTGPRGGTMTETLTLSADGAKLTQVRTVTIDGTERSHRVVFDRVG